jgi:hypothetical protein
MSSQDVHVEEQITDPESGWTWFIALVSMVILTVTIVICAVLFFEFEEDEIETKVIDEPAREKTELQSAQKGLLQVYESYTVIPIGGTEEDAQVQIRIPIEKAMEVVVAEARTDRANEDDPGTATTSVVSAGDKETVEK